jgi:hypothetical protein
MNPFVNPFFKKIQKQKRNHLSGLDFIAAMAKKFVLAVEIDPVKMGLWNFVHQFTAWTGGYRGRYGTI